MSALAIGLALALAVGVFASTLGFERDRAYYPTILVIVASYYVLFAVMAGSMRALAIEIAAMGVFVSVAVVGFRSRLTLVAAALAAHGVFDVFHGWLIANAGVPVWWPAFCASFDVAAGAYLAVRIATWRRASAC